MEQSILSLLQSDQSRSKTTQFKHQTQYAKKQFPLNQTKNVSLKSKKSSHLTESQKDEIIKDFNLAQVEELLILKSHLKEKELSLLIMKLVNGEQYKNYKPSSSCNEFTKTLVKHGFNGTKAITIYMMQLVFKHRHSTELIMQGLQFGKKETQQLLMSVFECLYVCLLLTRSDGSESKDRLL